MPTLHGSCHCGQLKLRFESTRPPEELPVRVCQCTFCVRHGSRCTSDPAGRIVVEIGEPAATSRYRFGMKSADFLICARCGVFLGAFMDDAASGPGAALAVLNLDALDDRARFVQPAQPMDYDAESLEQRLARRKERWTPATFGGATIAG
jgi:hypothetical protein